MKIHKDMSLQLLTLKHF